MFNVQFHVGQAFAAQGSDSYAAEALAILLQGLVALDVAYLRRNPRTPKLYALGRAGLMRYEREPRGQEWFRDIPSALAAGSGDCDDLACWRTAELRHEGIPAQAIFRVKKNAGGFSRMFHIVVMHPDGTLEDPSRALGMGRT